MNATVETALTLWGLEHATWRLIAARENRVFRVDVQGAPLALRLHRPGYRTDAELTSELDWMSAIAKGGLHVPAPVPSRSGHLLHWVDGSQVDVLTWVTGDPMQAPSRAGLFRKIGHEMARLHTFSDTWSPPQGFQRWSWDRTGLLGETPLWGRFWENPTLGNADQALFTNVREVVSARLGDLQAHLDTGLIHADLVPENILIDKGVLRIIDFDDAGYGFRLFDIATTLLKAMPQPDYSALQAALIAGYRSHRPIETDALDLFILLRALTYVGWIVPRMGEDGSEARNARFVSTARTLAAAYLEDHPAGP